MNWFSRLITRRAGWFTLVAVAVLGMSACSPAPMPISASANDPSNPAAPEGAPRRSPPLSSAPTAPATLPMHEHGTNMSASHGTTADSGVGAADAGAILYTCPMHSEVTSPTPGRCPKCGMNLVPKK